MARKIKLRWEKPVKKHLPRWCGTCKYINVIVGPNCLACNNNEYWEEKPQNTSENFFEKF